MRHGIHACPNELLDLREHGGAARLSDLGFEDVAVSAFEPSGRSLLPWAANGAVRQHAGGEAWFSAGGDYGVLRPVTHAEAETFDAVLDDLRAAGLGVWLSAALCRAPGLGVLHPRSCVQNAFGDRYRDALCPARHEVQDYAAHVVEDLARYGPDCIEVDAIGFGGHRGALANVATAWPGDAWIDFLLSCCFCDECSDNLGTTGLDAGAIRARVADLLVRRLFETDALDRGEPPASETVFARLEEDLGEAVMFAMWSYRLAVHIELLRRLRAVIGGTTRLAVRTQLRSVGTGETAGIPLKVTEHLVDALAVPPAGDGPAGVARALRGEDCRVLATRAIVRPLWPGYRETRDIAAALAAAEAAGAEGVWISRLGLLPWPTLERIGAVLRRTAPVG